MAATTLPLSSRPTLHVLVPVYNEAENVPRLIASFREMTRELEPLAIVKFLVVDDGSADDTTAVFERLRGDLALRTLRYAKNQGPGKAFGCGFSELADQVRPEDYVATIEGDNTCRLELLRQMLTRLDEGFDVVLASPYLYGGGIRNTSTYRTVLSNIANLVVKEGLGLHGIMTMSSFFRLHRGSALLRLQRAFGHSIVERTGFESMIEMLLKMVFLDFRISEVAMVLDTSRRAGKSKMKVLRTGLGYLTLIKAKARWWDMATHARTTFEPVAGASVERLPTTPLTLNGGARPSTSATRPQSVPAK